MTSGKTIVDRALELVADGSILGLGSGRAAEAFVKALAVRVRGGEMQVRGVPTSERTAQLARQEGIPLISLAEVEQLDLAIDGADEIDPDVNLIKGYGRAFVREKIVAAASRRLIILAGSEKLVPQLGTRGKLPVEVVPFALPLCEQRLRILGLKPVPYLNNGQLFVTDNGNYIIDCQVDVIEDAKQLDRNITAIPGVVGTGLFLEMADVALIGKGPEHRLMDERWRTPPP